MKRFFSLTLAAALIMAVTMCGSRSSAQNQTRETATETVSAEPAATPDAAVIKETPKAENAKLLDAILANYAGKTVLVDFWATWCGPCRAAHKALEPMKAGDLKDVQFVYITSETSPKTDWQKMVPGIKGDHYYLTDDQLGAIYSQIESNAFPTYIVVAKDGARKQFVGFSDEVTDAIKAAL